MNSRIGVFVSTMSVVKVIDTRIPLGVQSETRVLPNERRSIDCLLDPVAPDLDGAFQRATLYIPVADVRIPTSIESEGTLRAEVRTLGSIDDLLHKGSRCVR